MVDKYASWIRIINCIYTYYFLPAHVTHHAFEKPKVKTPNTTPVLAIGNGTGNGGDGDGFMASVSLTAQGSSGCGSGSGGSDTAEEK